MSPLQNYLINANELMKRKWMSKFLHFHPKKTRKWSFQSLKLDHVIEASSQNCSQKTTIHHYFRYKLTKRQVAAVATHVFSREFSTPETTTTKEKNLEKKLRSKVSEIMKVFFLPQWEIVRACRTMHYHNIPEMMICFENQEYLEIGELFQSRA